MDAVERGDSFTVTCGDREIATRGPLPDRRTFVPVDEFLALGGGLMPIDASRFPADLDPEPPQHD